jgi:hypothetical protein
MIYVCLAGSWRIPVNNSYSSSDFFLAGSFCEVHLDSIAMTSLKCQVVVKGFHKYKRVLF